MKKIYGMSIRDWKILGKILNPTSKVTGKKFYTVAEYIANNPDVKVERRTSPKGTKLVKVYYPSGKVTEYPEQHIDTTTAFAE